MDRPRRSPCILHDAVDSPDPEGMYREPSSPQVRHASEVFPDDPTLSVRRRRVQEDMPLVEGVAELIDPNGKYLGGTTYRRRKEKME